MLLKALCCVLVVLTVGAVLSSRLRGPRIRRGDSGPRTGRGDSGPRTGRGDSGPDRR